MSESLNNDHAENPNAKQWKNIDADLLLQQKIDSVDDRVLDNDLKENSEKRKQQFQEEIFAAKAAVLQSYKLDSDEKSDFAEEQEKYESQQTAKENHQKYGENLSAEAARGCFSKEYIALKNKFEKIKRAEKKEKEMSPKESQKSYKKRLKDGLIMSNEERKHLSEMDGMDNYEREEYGRKKRHEYLKIQEKKDAHPLKFRQLVRKNHLSIPKEWDDSKSSLDDYRRINTALILLDDKAK